MDIVFPPGVVNKQSRKTNTVNWRETNLIRWEDDTLMPVKGWEKINYGALGSPIRQMHRWSDNSGTRHVAILCEEHCYVDSGTGVLTDITPVDGLAPVDNTDEGGFGDGLFGTDAYGTPRDTEDRFNVATPIFTLDNWGEELRAMTSADGRLLRWSPATPSTPLVAVTNAPVQNRTFVVTPERFIILFGAGGGKSRFEWCDQEDDTNWTESTTSKAGGYDVEPASPIVTAGVTPFGVVMFTNRGGYLIQFIGLPFVYNYDAISECPPPLSPQSLVSTPDGLFWAALNGFWVYNGVTAAPITCSIWDWITARLNMRKSRFKASVVTINTKFENWWFFVSQDEELVNDRVVIYNYKTKTWSMGSLGRNCGSSIPSDPYPLMADDDYVYQHESGMLYEGTDKPWAESFTISMSRGSRLTTIKQMLPEVTGDPASVQFKFIKRNNPNDDGTETESNAKTIRSNGYVDVRETARSMRMRVEMIGENDWSLGLINTDVVGRGEK